MPLFYIITTLTSLCLAKEQLDLARKRDEYYDHKGD